MALCLALLYVLVAHKAFYLQDTLIETAGHAAVDLARLAGAAVRLHLRLALLVDGLEATSHHAVEVRLTGFEFGVRAVQGLCCCHFLLL
jgi:hypothetical protein